MKKAGIKTALIVILLIIVGAVIYGFFKFSSNIKDTNKTAKPKVTQQNNTTQTVTLSNISNSQILNIANGSMSNTNFTFKSVMNKSLVDNQLNVTLLGFEQVNGKYITQNFAASLQDVNGTFQLVPGSLESTNQSGQSNNDPAPEIASKESAISTVVQYLNSNGYNLNATDWAADAFPNQTIDGYTGNLVHVYETFNGNPTSVAWFLVSTNGTIYNAGSSGSGPITAV